MQYSSLTDLIHPKDQDKIVEVLLKNGADVNAPGYNGNRALYNGAGNYKFSK